MRVETKPPVPPRHRGAFFASGCFALCGLWLSLAARAAESPRPDLVLITLDTTRADQLGAYGATTARTPTLDALAKGGVRFSQAYSPVPLTLPAHASLLTGLLPAEHGLRDNGWGRLEDRHPLLAEALQRAGYRTAAFPSSRVLDARFGLDRGFDVYGDDMAAERVGQYGYPERPASEGVDAALAWLEKVPRDRPLFLWLHFYDPHTPYDPPAPYSDPDERKRYGGEIAFVDHELGRLLVAWPTGRRRLVAAVADHGEAFGEHGEVGHGLLLYQTTLHVPLLIAGPGAPSGQVIGTPVGSERLASTLLRLLGLPSTLPGPPLPLTAADEANEAKAPPPIFHETLFPGTSFGWSPLAAITLAGNKVIAAPRPEIYDLRSDPGENVNLLDKASSEQRRARRLLATHLEKYPLEVEPPEVDPEVAAELRSLGYLSGQSRKFGQLDPKDGVKLLADQERAGQLEGQGQLAEARRILASLVEKSPQSVPFLARLAGLEGRMGDQKAALLSLDRALGLSPQLDFLHLERGDLLLALGRKDEAAKAFRLALGLQPKLANAWLRLAEMALRAGKGDEEEKLLLEAAQAGTSSGVIAARLAEITLRRGDLVAADHHLEEATRLLPSWPAAWKMWAEVARRQGKAELAAEREKRAQGQR